MSAVCFCVINGCQKSSDGYELRDFFPIFRRKQSPVFLPEPDGSFVEEEGEIEYHSSCRFEFEKEGVNDLINWIADLRTFIKIAEKSGCAPMKTLHDFLMWPTGLLYGPKMCVKISEDLAAWRPLIGCVANHDFLTIYRYFQEMFGYAGSNGLFGLEEWNFAMIPNYLEPYHLTT